jgi:hypothetical protein
VVKNITTPSGSVTIKTPLTEKEYETKLSYLKEGKRDTYIEQQGSKEVKTIRGQTYSVGVIGVVIVIIAIIIAYAMVTSLAKGLKEFEVAEATRLANAKCILADLPADYPTNRTDLYFDPEHVDEAREYYLMMCDQYTDWWQNEVIPQHEQEMAKLRLTYWTSMLTPDSRHMFGNALHKQFCEQISTSSNSGGDSTTGYCGAPWNFRWTPQWGWLAPMALPSGFITWGERLNYAPLTLPCQSSVACLFMLPDGWQNALFARMNDPSFGPSGYNNPDDWDKLPSAHQQVEAYNAIILNLINSYDLSVKNLEPLCLASNL